MSPIIFRWKYNNYRYLTWIRIALPKSSGSRSAKNVCGYAIRYSFKWSGLATLLRENTVYIRTVSLRLTPKETNLVLQMFPEPKFLDNFFLRVQGMQRLLWKVEWVRRQGVVRAPLMCLYAPPPEVPQCPPYEIKGDINNPYPYPILFNRYLRSFPSSIVLGLVFLFCFCKDWLDLYRINQWTTCD